MCGVTETDCACTAYIRSQNSEHCKFEFNITRGGRGMPEDPVVRHHRAPPASQTFYVPTAPKIYSGARGHQTTALGRKQHFLGPLRLPAWGARAIGVGVCTASVALRSAVLSGRRGRPLAIERHA